MSNHKISEVIQLSYGGGTHQHAHTGKAPTSIHTRERPEHETIKMSELGSAVKAPTSKHTKRRTHQNHTRGRHPPARSGTNMYTHNKFTETDKTLYQPVHRKQREEEPISTHTTSSQEQMVHWTNLSAKTKRANMSEFSNLEPFARLNNKRLGRINQHAHRGEAHISMHAGEMHQLACTQGRGINGMHTDGRHPPACTQGGGSHQHERRGEDSHLHAHRGVTPMSMYWYSEPACLQQTKGDTWVSWLTLYYFTDLYLRRLSILPPTKQKTHLQQTCNNKWLCQNSMQQIIETSEEQSHV